MTPKNAICMRCEVLIAVTVKSTVFVLGLFMLLYVKCQGCGMLVEVYRSVRGICCLHLQDPRISQANNK
jgi:hypothetical protein